VARTRQIIETVTCDLCGRQADDASTVRLGWGAEQWELDLCPDDAASVSAAFNAWTAKGRPVSGRAGSASRGRGTARTPAANDDWTYLESLGFKRHRGRKTVEEQAALARR